MDWNDSIDVIGQDDLDTSQVVGWQDKQANYSFPKLDFSLDDTLEVSAAADDLLEEPNPVVKRQTPKKYPVRSSLKAHNSNSGINSFVLQIPLNPVPSTSAFIDLTEGSIVSPPSPVLSGSRSIISVPSSPILGGTRDLNAPSPVLGASRKLFTSEPPSPIFTCSPTYDSIGNGSYNLPVKNVPEPPPVEVRFIAGVRVEFPVKPYPAQILIMFKLITGITKQQHCLLESPTGTGKTLALLCGALAWQKHEKERIFKQAADKEPEFFTPPKLPKQDDNCTSNTTVADTLSLTPKKFGKKSIYYDSDEESGDKLSANYGKQEFKENYDESLVRIHKRPKMSMHESPSKQPKVTGFETPPKNLDSQSVISSPVGKSCCAENPSTPEKLTVPKIFYGTRTHKQLQQVIKEFKRTAYSKDIKMTILSSREQSCVQCCEGTGHRNKDELCKELLDKKVKPKYQGMASKTACEYYDGKHKIHHKMLPPVWDIEELCNIARERVACAYFGAKALASSAEIIFCPYNYIIDPKIRDSMSIDLDDSIIILDEAHNIEDTCRESASITLEQAEVNAAKKDIDHVLKQFFDYRLKEHYEHLSTVFGYWEDWFNNNAPMMEKKSEYQSVHIFEGKDLIQSFNNHKIGYWQLKDFKTAAYEVVSSLKMQQGGGDMQPCMHVSTATVNLLERLIFILPKLFSSTECEDFLGALKRKSEFGQQSQSQSGWHSKKNPVGTSELSLAIWCMNPALIFSELTKARCIALGSGTLSPAQSLPSELATAFPLTVTGNHVIAKERVWVGALKFGPKHMPLECTFRNNGRSDFQDSIGEVLLWVCKNTPHGVLCFVPSYRLLENFQNRWMQTGLWDKLKIAKYVFLESRSGRDHNEIMNQYYSCVDSEMGALLFAVFRGKVSEGMDFKDHQARAVISIGIPYPNSHEDTISRKMKYNDKHKKMRNLLSGSDWLQIQAYRALNQALGRCVRHAGDWGAVLLIDSRFENEYYTKYISKWVRSFMPENPHSWSSLTQGPNSLDKFMKRMSLTTNS